MKTVNYLRQSTLKQERSNLSIEAQRFAVNNYCQQRGYMIVTEFVETESGRNNDRPKLKEALALCRANGYLLVISKLDRLARNASFLLGLRESGVDFACCDLPDANRLTIGLLAVLAEQEADAISQRTKDALQAKKRRCELQGVPFFKSQGETLRRVQPAGIAVIKQRASERILERKPAILRIFHGSGEGKYLKTAEILNELGVASLSGKLGAAWTATGVRRLVLSGS